MDRLKQFASDGYFLSAMILVVIGSWAYANAASIIFTAGLISITIGFAFWFLPLAFIVPGIIVCFLTAFPPLVTFLRGS